MVSHIMIQHSAAHHACHPLQGMALWKDNSMVPWPCRQYNFLVLMHISLLEPVARHTSRCLSADVLPKDMLKC